MICKFHHLKLMMYNSWGNIKNGLITTGPSDLVVPYPACPIPSINLQDEWERVPKEMMFKWNSVPSSYLTIFQVSLYANLSFSTSVTHWRLTISHVKVISPTWVSFTIHSTDWLDSVVKAARYMHALGLNPGQVSKSMHYFLLPSARMGPSKCHSEQFHHILLLRKIVAVHLAKLLTDSFSNETKLNGGSKEKWCCQTILVSNGPHVTKYG